MPASLPIYRVESDDSSIQHLVDLGQRIFQLSNDFKLGETNGSHVLHGGQRVVDLATESGGVWAADEAQLWKPSLQPELPKEDEAIARANELVRERKLLPKLENPFRIGTPVVGGTYF